MKKNALTFRKRRSVAPVIATLLMVAIAVVGGMLVFVFAQDFFTQTESMTGPRIEQLQIYGYDFRDTAGGTIENHAGIGCAAASVGVKGGTLATSDLVALYVRNNGNQPIFINDVSFFGTTPSSEAAAVVSATHPLTDEWGTITDDLTCTTAADLPIQPGERATVVTGWANAYLDGVDVALKVGRPVFVSITTDAGNVFTKTVINGRAVG